MRLPLILATVFLAAVGHADEPAANLLVLRNQTSATVGDSVVRGERHEYVVEAIAGQRLTVTITSLEDNAVFEVFSHDGDSWVAVDLPPDSRAWSGLVAAPATGRYRIDVGGTRGNATYELFVGRSPILH